MVEVNIKYFGMLTDSTGKTSEQISIKDNCTIGELDIQLKSKYNKLNGCKYQIAMNNQFITDTNIPLSTGVQVSLLPPFSGG